jgi:hypothetical protein
MDFINSVLKFVTSLPILEDLEVGQRPEERKEQHDVLFLDLQFPKPVTCGCAGEW